MPKLSSNKIIGYCIVSSIFLLVSTKLSSQEINNSLLIKIDTQLFVKINGLDNAIFHYVEYLTTNLDTNKINRVCILKDPIIESFYFKDDILMLKNRIREIETIIEQRTNVFTFLNREKIELLMESDQYNNLKYKENKYEIFRYMDIIESIENELELGQIAQDQARKAKANAETKIKKLSDQNEKLTSNTIAHNTAFLKINMYDYEEHAIAIKIHVVDAHSEMVMSKYEKCMHKVLVVSNPTNAIDFLIEFKEIKPKILEEIEDIEPTNPNNTNTKEKD